MHNTHHINIILRPLERRSTVVSPHLSAPLSFTIEGVSPTVAFRVDTMFNSCTDCTVYVVFGLTVAQLRSASAIALLHCQQRSSRLMRAHQLAYDSIGIVKSFRRHIYVRLWQLHPSPDAPTTQHLLGLWHSLLLCCLLLLPVFLLPSQSQHVGEQQKDQQLRGLLAGHVAAQRAAVCSSAVWLCCLGDWRSRRCHGHNGDSASSCGARCLAVLGLLCPGLGSSHLPLVLLLRVQHPELDHQHAQVGPGHSGDWEASISPHSTCQRPQPHRQQPCSNTLQHSSYH